MTAQWLIEDEWLDWYRLSPEERWRETQKLWSFYLKVGGSLDTEPDSQSPFDAFPAERSGIAHGGARHASGPEEMSLAVIRILP
jgi:hypothetical protein